MKNIREIADEMKTLLNSRGYGITSVFGMYLDNNAMMVIKDRINEMLDSLRME